ncbi:MAG: type II toxin-antitoxin system RelE/ParE family toxin [Clostridiales Family XIII bacterium]|jgi:phage-related protein|nr:type II toxin-antitoxin system RelE/ParE family toxin [Clostridiales Family XIII bacterium]
MFSIYYYADDKGDRPVWDYMQSLAKKHDKGSRIKYNKIVDYIRVLSDRGKGAGQPYIKHLGGDIWELRPIRDRILFAAWDDEVQGFILLHQFMKQTQKTPQKEIDTATRRLKALKRGK